MPPTNLKATTLPYVVVSPDKLSVKSTSKGQICLVQANKTVPVNTKRFYFEIQVKNVNSNTSGTSIGYTNERSNLSNFMGLEANSVGYLGQNGFVYVGGRRNDTLLPTFGTNDVVGAGVSFASNEFFFTKNGALVGTTSKDFDCQLFPTVGIYGLDTEVEVNFGHKPFVYEVKAKSPSPYSYRLDNDNTELASSSNEENSWKKLFEKGKSLLEKSIEEKKNEVASLEAVLKSLSDSLDKFL
ncbi:Ran-binding protein M homolog [Linum grandiflorum]